MSDIESKDAEETTSLPPLSHPPDENETPQKGRKKLIALIVAAVVVIALVVTGVVIWRARAAHGAAVEACQVAVKKADKAHKAVDTATDDASEAAKITEDQVADKTTITALKSAISEQSPKAVSCSEEDSTEHLATVTDQISTNVTSLKNQAKSITTAAGKVTASQAQKELDDATKSLTDTISAAQGTYDTSSGKVSDEKTRESLKSALDLANKEVKNEKRTVKSLTDQKAQLYAAVKAVNDSVKSKADADAKAAAAAAAAQAQRNSTTYRNTNTYRNNSGGGTSTYVAPQNNGGSSGGNSSGGSWGGYATLEEYLNRPDPLRDACKDPTKFCPIG